MKQKEFFEQWKQIDDSSMAWLIDHLAVNCIYEEDGEFIYSLFTHKYSHRYALKNDVSDPYYYGRGNTFEDAFVDLVETVKEQE